ncbi:LOW QUALITY PROTEIN: hypothetical protein KUTeg_018885 [Tegillarca granosa]|uniref:Protein fantom n=1 Tax=Tegillarca granosa TaxID=220873 RepID=A0ABQ9ED26_TEGGR|nr:LOW QUALITY PROTEIN: hypothetical protein KUTeg_018885 [Tegillarca granosa]
MDPDMIPVRDPGGGKNMNEGAAQQRRMVSKWDRDTLEDKYLRLHEENLILKKHARKQEDKIKSYTEVQILQSMDPDMIPVRDPGGGKNMNEGAAQQRRMVSKWDRDTLEDKYLRLHEENLILKKHARKQEDKIKRDIETEEKIEELHDKLRDMDKQNIQLKEKLMLAKQQLATNNKRQTPYNHVGSRINTIQQLQEQLNMYEMEMENMKQQLKLRETEYEGDLVKIKQQITAEQRVTVQENIDMIKLQREVKEKSTKMMVLQEKYVLLEENFNRVKRSHDGIIMEMENLNMQLKEEQNRLQEQVASLEKENQILKEANEKFVSSAFDLEREREWRQRENALKVQIAQLEATLKADLGEKGGIIDKYARERELHEKLQQEYRELQLQHYQIKEEYDDIKEKMKFFTKESAVDFTEIEEALVLVKQKKQKSIPKPDFLQKVDEELSKDANRHLLELQAEYAETIHELEKTRNMLVVQHKINKDYQQEICTNKMDDVKKEYEMKLDEYARLLDIRAARIKDDSMVEFDETVHLERGQNLFEIHVTKQLNDEEPCIFCTWEFFEYEIQATPVLRGPRPEFDFTSQYIVKVDDFFLHYLQKETCTLELHQSFGQDYRTIAACQLVFKDIFDKPQGRIHGVATLTCVDPDGTGIGFGTVEYWIRLRVPMEQALRLYKERTKALGYITINERATEQALEALDETAAKRPKDNINELHVKIVRCSKLRPRRENVQPSPYCVYQFFDYNDHDTVILQSTNDPEFNDHKTYPPLKIFVFDDTDPEQTAYMGIADIPLIPLVHNKGVQGVFELKTADGGTNGTVEVELRWQFTYVPPKSVSIPSPQTQEQTPTVAAPQVTPEKLQEEPRPPPGAPGTPVHHRQRIAAKFPQPSATSTPMPKQMEKRKPDESEHPSDSMVNEAVSRAISDIMPHTGLSDTISDETMKVGQPLESTIPEEQAPSGVSPRVEDQGSEVEEEGSIEEEVEEEVEEEIEEEVIQEETMAVPLEDTATGEDHTDQTEGVSVEETKEETLSPKAMSDTMFGDKTDETETVSEEAVTPSDAKTTSKEPPRVETESESDRPVMESDSEGLVMMAPTPAKRRQKAEKRQELETPISLPKPKLGQQCTFNFSKTFKVDLKHNYERRQYLARFVLMFEPPEDDQEGDCEDVGVAFVSVIDILKNKKDVVDQNIDLYDVNDEKTVIGSMNVTVQCYAALEAVEKELSIEGTY